MPVPYILANPVLDANFAWTGNGTVTSIGLSSTDLTVSNSPVTTSGNITANLTTTGVSAATYGSSTQVAQFTVDTKGRISAASNVAIASVVSFGSGAPAGAPSTGEGSLYFDTSVSPYQGYVYHSAAWHTFT